MSEPAAPDCISGIRHPRENSQLFGHQAGEQALLQAVSSERLHHAWVITGAQGIGKATLCYRFAKYLLANGTGAQGLFGPPDSLEMPEDQPDARQVAAGTHGNLYVLRRGLNDSARPPSYHNVIRIQDVRRMIPFLQHTAHGNGWRAVIVDAAEDMNVNAQNGLLKILEEPPAKTVFLLACNAPGRLLATVRSRCRTLPLTPLTAADSAAVISACQPDINTDDLEILARMTEGRPGHALQLGLSDGISIYREMIDLLSALPSVNAAKIHAFSENIGRRSEVHRYRLFTEMVQSWLMRLIKCRATGEAGLEVLPGEGEMMSRVARMADLDQWVQVWEKAAHLVDRADAVNLDPRTVTLNLFVALGETAEG